MDRRSSHKERNLTSPWFWNERQIGIVRMRYECTMVSARSLAPIVGKSPSAIKNKARSMGLGRGFPLLRPWTEREIETLTEYITRLPVHQLAKELKRSVSAVTSKAQKLKLSRRARDGHYTAQEISEILGVPSAQVLRWIQHGEIKAEPSREPKSNGAVVRWIVEEKVIRDFIISSARLLSGRNIDLLAVVFILTGAVGVGGHD